MTINREILSAIGNAKMFAKSGNANFGNYLLEIQKAVYDKMTNGTFFVLEFKVVESAKTDPREDPQLPGATFAERQNMIKKGAEGRVRAAVTSIMNSLPGVGDFEALCAQDSNLFAQSMVDLLEPSGLFPEGKSQARGLRVRAEVVETETLGKVKIHAYRYSPVDPKQNTPELVAARRGSK